MAIAITPFLLFKIIGNKNMADRKRTLVIDVKDGGKLKERIKALTEINKKIDQINTKKVGGGLSASAKAATKATGGLSNALQETSVSAGVTNRAFKGVSGQTSNTTKQFAKMSQGLGGLVSVYATVAANAFAASAAFNVFKRSADIENVIAAQKELGKTSGIALGVMSRGLKDVTGGAISLANASKAASLAVSAGFDSRFLERLGNVAAGASKALGRDLTDAITRLTTGISKLEPEILDELGIFVKIEKATQIYADRVGKARDQLTEFERRQAFATEALRQGEKAWGNINAAVADNPFDVVSASLADITQQILGFVASPIGSFLKGVAENGTALVGVITIFASTLAKLATPSLQQYAISLQEGAAQSKKFAITARDTARAAKETAKFTKSFVGANQIAGLEEGIKDLSLASTTLSKNMQTSTLVGKEFLSTFGNKFRSEVSKAATQLKKTDKITKGMFKNLKVKDLAGLENALDGLVEIDKTTGKITLTTDKFSKSYKLAMESSAASVKVFSSSVKTAFTSVNAQLATAKFGLAAQGAEYARLRTTGVGAISAMVKSWAVLNTQIAQTSILTKLATRSIAVMTSAARLVGTAFSKLAGPIGIALTAFALFGDTISNLLSSIGLLSKGFDKIGSSATDLSQIAEATSALTKTLKETSEVDLNKLSSQMSAFAKNAAQGASAVQVLFDSVKAAEIGGFSKFLNLDVTELSGAREQGQLFTQTLIQNLREVGLEGTKAFLSLSNAQGRFIQAKGLDAGPLKDRLVSIFEELKKAMAEVSKESIDQELKINNLSSSFTTLSKSSSKYIKSLEGSTRLDNLVTNVGVVATTIEEAIAKGVKGNKIPAAVSELITQIANDPDLKKLVDLNILEGTSPTDALKELNKFVDRFKGLAQQIKDAREDIQLRNIGLASSRATSSLLDRQLTQLKEQGILSADEITRLRLSNKLKTESEGIEVKLLNLISTRSFKLAEIAAVSGKERVQAETRINTLYGTQITALERQLSFLKGISEQARRNLVAQQARAVAEAKANNFISQIVSAKEHELDLINATRDALRDELEAKSDLTELTSFELDNAAKASDFARDRISIIESIAKATLKVNKVSLTGSKEEKGAAQDSQNALIDKLKILDLTEKKYQSIVDILRGNIVRDTFRDEFNNVADAVQGLAGQLSSQLAGLVGNISNLGNSIQDFNAPGATGIDKLVAGAGAIGAAISIAGALFGGRDDDPQAIADAITDSFSKAGLRGRTDKETNALTGAFVELSTINVGLSGDVRSLQKEIIKLNDTFSKVGATLSKSFGTFGESFAASAFGTAFGTVEKPGILGIGAKTTSTSLLASGISVAGGLTGTGADPTSVKRASELFSISLNQTVAFAIEQVTTTKSGIFGIGGGTKSRVNRKTEQLSRILSSQLEDAFIETIDTTFSLLATLAPGFFASDKASQDLADSWVTALFETFSSKIELGLFDDLLDGVDLDLTAKSSSEVAATIAAFFNEVSDETLGALVPGLEKFQRAGEELGDALARLSKLSINIANTINTLLPEDISKGLLSPSFDIGEAARTVANQNATLLNDAWDNLISNELIPGAIRSINEAASGTVGISSRVGSFGSFTAGREEEFSFDETMLNRLISNWPLISESINQWIEGQSPSISIPDLESALGFDLFTKTITGFTGSDESPQAIIKLSKINEQLVLAVQMSMNAYTNALEQAAEEGISVFDTFRDFSAQASIAWNDTVDTFFGSTDVFADRVTKFNQLFDEITRLNIDVDNAKSVITGAFNDLGNGISASSLQFADDLTMGAGTIFTESVRGIVDGLIAGTLDIDAAKASYLDAFTLAEGQGLFSQELFDGIESIGAKFFNTAINTGAGITELATALEALEGSAPDASQSLEELAAFMKEFSDRVLVFGQSDLFGSLISLRREFADLTSEATSLGASEAELQVIRKQGQIEASTLIKESIDALTNQAEAFNDAISGALDNIEIVFTSAVESFAGLSSEVDAFLKTIPSSKELRLQQTVRDLNKATVAYNEFLGSRGATDLSGLGTEADIARGFALLSDLRQATVDRYTTEISLIAETKEAAENSASALRSAMEGVADTLKTLVLGPLSILSKQDKLITARSDFEGLVSAFKVATDPDEQAKLLQDISSASIGFLEISRDYYAGTGTFVEDFLDVQKVLNDIQSTSSLTLQSTEQLINEKLTQIRNLTETAKNELNALIIDDTNVAKTILDQLSLINEQLISEEYAINIADAFGGLTIFDDLASAIETLGTSLVTLAAQAAASAPIAGVGDSLGPIEQLYTDILKRSADDEGLAFWRDQLATGSSIDAIANAIRTSPEAQALNEANAMQQFAHGGIARRASIFGEAGPEAAVPLPDGRRIPVDLGANMSDVGDAIREGNRELIKAIEQQGEQAERTAEVLQDILLEANAISKDKTEQDKRLGKFNTTSRPL